ncbi:Uncharacterised protein [BD1-7 clade bacterium]|uniref:Tail specific protease domain-containing protein n=1 Tax=BD1-7 clade bacterium TaxID=2029982 RepID=A0A5S9PRN0_9GAMM|nr:Uncharacterised protein [BD1-7 clade bacterium]
MLNTHIKRLSIQNLSRMLSFLLIFLLAGCDSDNSQSSGGAGANTNVNAQAGIWVAPAYGIAVDIRANDFTFYQFTGDYCQIYPIVDLLGIDYERLVASFNVNDDGNILQTTLAGVKVPGIMMEKQNQLPQHCIDNLETAVGDANYEFSARRDFEIFWQTYNELYAFFELEDLNWADVYDQASLDVNDDTSEEELFGIFAQMVTPLRDFHVEIINPVIGFEYTSPSRKTTIDRIALADFLSINDLEAISNEAEYLQFIAYLEEQKDSALSAVFEHVAEGEEIRFNDTQTLVWARMRENVGYLLINTMDDNELGGSESIEENLVQLASMMDQVILDLVGVKALVIDIRYNEGGDDFVSQYIAGRLTNQSFDAYRKQSRVGATRTPLQTVRIEVQGETQYTGPIAVLSSMSTSSAAEVFSLIMHEREMTLAIGEATAGGFSDQLIKILPSGMVYTLSNEIYSNMAGVEFEGFGAPVDVEIDFFTREQREGNIDMGFEEALLLLRNF